MERLDGIGCIEFDDEMARVIKITIHLCKMWSDAAKVKALTTRAQLLE